MEKLIAQMQLQTTTEECHLKTAPSVVQWIPFGD